MPDFQRNYAPAGPVMKAFHESDAFVRIVEGPVGSGKSTGCSVELIRRAHEQAKGPDGKRRTRWAVIRNTFPELMSTTVPTWQTWMPVGSFRKTSPPTHVLRTDDVDMEVLFLALDSPEDVKKLLSLELTGAWANELRELPKAVIDQLTGRVGRYPSMVDGGPTWFGVIGDTNMPDSDHWLHQFAEEATPEGWQFFRQPGGVLKQGDRWVPNSDAENVDHLPGNYYRNQLAGKSEDWIKVYLAAEYGYAIDGKPVYPEYRDSLHVASGPPLAPVPDLPILIGMDFGLTPAAVFGQCLADGRWIVLDELVAEDMGVTRFSEILSQHLASKYPNHRHVLAWGDPAGSARAQTDEQTSIGIVREHAGLDIRPAPSNVWTVRREAVAGALSRLVDGEPGFLLSSSCRVLRKGFAGGYRYRRMKVAGDERYHDSPDKNAFSHPHDALQYMMLGGGEGAGEMGKHRRRARAPRFETAETGSPF